ncbi:MAG: DUF2974 domain-containing protein [Spirochaetaceae bacterium]|jgi:hypothetical protein|nr:DUF2974 domain-containing protein [Spirochaetaceae bacterium]
MNYVFDYLNWRGDLSFNHAPFNPVDNVIFSIISYYPFEGIVDGFNGSSDGLLLYSALDELIEDVKTDIKKLNMYHFFKEAQYDLMTALRKSERYKNVKLAAFVNHIDKDAGIQFSAATFLPEENRPAYIAFRGTDDTLIGWKEDFNMIFTDAIPAQLAAVDYIQKAATLFEGEFYAGGHSKGGNLAVYAGTFCDSAIKQRIIKIYSNDGPGFSKKIVESAEYNQIAQKVVSYIPQDSIIGLLFESRAYCVIKSDGEGFMSHNPFLWEVMRNDLCKVDAITTQSRFVNKTLMDWLELMDCNQRKEFISTLFDLLSSTNAKSIPDLTADWLKTIHSLVGSLNNMDKETHIMLRKTFNALFEAAKDNLVKGIEKRYFKKKEPEPEIG